MSEFENEYTWGKAVDNNSTDDFHADFDKAIDEVKKELGKKYPIIINGKEITSNDCFVVNSPSDTRIRVAEFPKATVEDTKNAISSAKNTFEEWSRIPYQKRVEIFRDCANMFSNRKFFLAAIMTFENGKNRIESMGDVDETIDFMRFYALQLEKNEGFCKQTSHPNPHEKTQTIMKPYGVWGIIAPFNFPSAIAIGMTTGALITGNTTVLKPASDAPLSSFQFAKVLYPKLPDGAINFVTGSGSIVGKTLIESSDIDGIAFTGSQEVGMRGFHEFTKTSSKPFISEMGGKNPVIVTKHADLEKATEGVMNAAFGFGGQKCSACSRVYVQDEIAEQFISKLVKKTKELEIGMPWKKEVFLGPVINKDAKMKFENVVDIAKKDGEILTGGTVLKSPELENGYFVEPTIVTKLPEEHKLVKEELFLPFLCIQKYDDFDDAIKLANQTEYGLTAGIFSNDQKQLNEFFSKIQAGVVYTNRSASATTAALVSSQPFVGWKHSGSTGKGAGGENYLQQFMRTQTQTRCD
ncbi:1-pyrroline-5-carboxylate dehydrogenase protein [Marine Group I thaumarchaeote SCGC AAA799-P11]|uniref:L-glutamate gamma-semialdehyde dehydrogenase n=1 Tax=Marine Group I thaumarchaeote SCGC AAA799-P11 TaxID=1502295 RepID=A0A087RZC3_9ARCH|nr:1-pyrroline-5-carboxylate dehydrogenase protein [Marine Group I thaumarchaeote SCGC AAA799-P11]